MAKQKWPDWSRQPFYRFLDYFENEQRLIWLAATGIQQVVRAAGIAETLYGVRHLLDRDPESEAKHLSSALEAAEMATIEVEADFPLLHAHSLMGVWGALEALIDDLVLVWLTHRPSLMRTEEFSAVRIPLALFQAMTVRERVEFLVDQIPRSAGVGGGFPRFELLLSRIDLGGPIEDGLRRSLIEAHQVRNVYAHRGGLADQRAIAACPWQTGWKPDGVIRVGHADYERYVAAIHDYVLLLIERTGRKFGVDVQARLEERGAEIAAARRKELQVARRRRVAAARRRIAKKKAAADEVD
jgi:hypothetical protein